MRRRGWGIIGQIRIVAGEIWDSPANMCLKKASPGWLAPQREALCALIALGGPPLLREPVEGRALSALSAAFFAAHGSVTTRLQRAVSAANKLMYEDYHKASAKGSARPGPCGGVVCLLLRRDGVYVAQVGSPKVYVSAGGSVDCLASPQPDVLLGRQQHIVPHLVRLPTAPDARFLLTDGQWDNAAVGTALAKPSGKTAWQAILPAIPRKDASVCLVGREPPARQGPTRPRGIPLSARHPTHTVESQTVTPTHSGGRLPLSRRPAWSRFLNALWRWATRTAREIAEGMLPRPLSTPPGAVGQPARGKGASWDAPLFPYLPWVALGIPLVIGLLTVLFYWRMQVAGGADAATYLQQAREILSIAAQPNTDQAAARIYLRSALDQIDAALSLRPDRNDAQELREEARRQLDFLNRVTRTPFVEVLYDYSAESELVRVLEAETSLYVLDQGTNRVYRHRLDAAGRSLVPEDTGILIQQGQQLAGRTVGPLVDMVWLAAGEDGRLLVLDMYGTLWAYSAASGLQVIALTEDPDLLPERDWRLAGYGERLYILAPGWGQVFRYLVLENSLGEADSYLPPETQAHLAGVMDISIDGYVYLLQEDGTVVRFLAGSEEPLTVAVPDGPLGRTSALFAHPEEGRGYLYIVDTTRQRVVQLTKGGECVQQLMAQDPNLFTDLRSLFVDEARGRLLIFDGNRLLLAEIPPPGLLTS